MDHSCAQTNRSPDGAAKEHRTRARIGGFIQVGQQFTTDLNCVVRPKATVKVQP